MTLASSLKITLYIYISSRSQANFRIEHFVSSVFVFCFCCFSLEREKTVLFFNAQGRWYILSLVVQYDRRTTKQCECSTGDRTLWSSDFTLRCPTAGQQRARLSAGLLLMFLISVSQMIWSCKEMWAILAKKAILSLCSSFLFSGFSWFSAGLYHWLHETRGEDTIHWWKRALESVNKNKPGTTASKEGEVLSFF